LSRSGTAVAVWGADRPALGRLGTVPARVDQLTRDLLQARTGDRRAFAAVVRGSQADIWRLCAHLVGRTEADDITQDTFVRVVRALPAFRGESSARTWLLAIARRACADAVRRHVRARRRDAMLAPSEAAAPDLTPTAEVDLLLAELDNDQRAAFVLTQLHGLAYAEAAEVCNVPIGTIRSRVARARATLVETLRAADAV
jgi:RNA polymerase sigma-70 factor, ECF subfamily